MKYVKLFEAFDSTKLSKTLAFINKESRTNFISLLKNISYNIDLPLSKLSDEYFEYLPFKKALKLNYSYTDEPCTATSKDSYPNFYIPGSSCDKGYVDRKWGTGIRKAMCTVCEGTGIAPNNNYVIKWIKFWFDKDGNFILATITDGKYRNQSKYGETSGIDLGNYEIEKNLEFQELIELGVGTPILINLKGRDTIAKIWKGKYGNRDATFAIQDSSAGSSDSLSDDWMKYGDLSWVISSDRDYNGVPKLLKLKTGDIEVNPYTWNAPFSINRYYNGFNISNSSSVENLLSKAHFSIVMNYLDIKNSTFKRANAIRSEREEAKSGAFKTDKDAKYANIQKYISTLTNNAKLPKEIENLNATIFRFMGGGYAGIYVLRGNNFSDFSDFLSYLYQLFEKDDKESAYRNALSYLKDIIGSNIQRNNEISSSLSEIGKFIRDNKKTEYMPILDSILDLNSTINKKIKSMEFKSIEDLEIAFEKLKSLRNVFKSSERIRMLDIYYILDSITNPSRAYHHLVQIDVEACLERFKKFKKFVERL